MVNLAHADHAFLPVNRQNRLENANLTNGAAERHQRFLDTSSTDTLAAWNDLLRLQVEAFAADELGFLACFPPWQEASDVLDVGCGNGLYASALRARFPAKSYTGIDVSPGLIAEARAVDPAIEFAAADFFSFAPDRTFDLIMMRFLIQHLTDFTAVLDCCSKLVYPRGGILIIEPDLHNSRNDPPTPLFESLLLEFERSRNDNGRMRTRIANPRELVSGARHWELIADETVTIRPSVSSARSLFLSWIDTFERSGLIEFPFGEARHELQKWSGVAGASTTIALRAVYLRHTT